MSTDAKEKEAPLPLKKKQVSHPLLLTCLASMLLTVLTILFTYIILGFAPFGDQALIYKDGQQQMIDLLCWFKDVLTGKSSISYSFSKHLGGSNFAVLSGISAESSDRLFPEVAGIHLHEYPVSS